jgi:hypothetical protein
MSMWRGVRDGYVLQRLRMFQQHPYCHWCNCKLVLPKPRGTSGWNAQNKATIDHLLPRGHPQRLDGNPNRERRRVLACRRCNSARPNPYAQSGAYRSLEEAWRASGHWPRMAYQHGALPGEVA